MYTFEDLKYNKLYKKNIHVPYSPDDKRHNSAIILLSPDSITSNRLMNNPFTKDNLKLFVSYYIEKDITHIINNEGYITTEYRDFDNNGILLESSEPSFIETTDIIYESDHSSDDMEINELCYRNGNKMVIWPEILSEGILDTLTSKYKRLIYGDRLRTMKDVINLYDTATSNNPWIKYTFPRLERYKQRNLYIDLYYYIQTYLTNNNYNIIKSNDMFLEFINRLLKDRRYIDAGYKKFIIYIPIYGWNNKNIPLYDYRTNLNPISIIYKKLRLDQSALKVFDGYDIIFFGNKGYFKFNTKYIPINFYTKFKRFIDILESDMDISEDEPKDSTNGIIADVIEDIENSTGAKINNMTGRNIDKQKTTEIKDGTSQPEDSVTSVNKPKTNDQQIVGSELPSRIEIVKQASTKAIEDNITLNDKEASKNKIVQKVTKAAEISRDKEDMLEILDKDLEFKQLLNELENETDMGNFKIDASRASAISKINDKLLAKTINNKSVKEILANSNKPKELDESAIPINTINKEWHHVKAINFEKEYDVNADIVKILYSLSDTNIHQYPIAISNINYVDTSTTEDLKYTYTISCENYKQEQFQLKFDIPKFRDNRFMRLRGNEKIISIEMPLIPISKTDENITQIVSLYKKIFVMTANTSSGKSNPYSDKLLKALKNNKSKDIKVYNGDNSRICEKYQLPIDYIDIASTINKIVYNSPNAKEEITIYFNLDEILKVPGISLKNGIPIAMSKSGKVIYYTSTAAVPLSIFIANIIDIPEFQSLYTKTNAVRRATYSQAKVLNTFIPIIIILAHDIGLTKAMELAGIDFKITKTRPADDPLIDIIKFSDGFLSYKCTYNSMMLMNGLKNIETTKMSIMTINKKITWINQLENFGGIQKSEGLDNFKELMFDPITVGICKDYKLPQTYHEALIYASNLLVDNKHIKTTNISSNRYRTNEVVAAQFYGVLSSAYHMYISAAKRNKRAVLSMKQTAVIDAILAQNNTSDLSVFQPLLEVEKKNEISFKGYAGLNEEHSYTLEKRSYDKSMENIIAQSTNHAANVGINRQTTIDPNITGGRGYFKMSDISKENSVTKSMGITEAVSPFMTTSDDAYRNDMSFVQTSKHSTPIKNGMPLLVTTGADQALPYLSSNMFAYKAKNSGKVVEITPKYMLIEYSDKSKDYIILDDQTMKNSDGGFYITLKLITDLKVNDRFNKDDILAWDEKSFSKKVGLKQLSYNVGCLAKIAIFSSEDGYEDSGVCSEWLSEAMASDIINLKEVVLHPSTNVLKMVKVGDKVNEGDEIMIYQNAFDDEDVNNLLKNLNIEDGDISEVGKSIIRSSVTGVISDIKLYRTCEIKDMSDSLQKIFKIRENEINKLKQIAVGAKNENIRFDPSTKVEQLGKMKSIDNGILIEIYMKYNDRLAVGDKCTNLNANKVVLMDVFPTEDAPYTDYRPEDKIDVISSASSIDARMITSPFKNGALNKLMIELQRKCAEIYGKKALTVHEIYDYYNKN